jgi:3-methyladenine DNA glycosylase AlkD
VKRVAYMTGMIEMVEYIRREFAKLANPGKARAMAAYMKTSQPFYGVNRPEQRRLVRAARRQFPPANRREYERAVLALWRLPHREEQYAAIEFARTPDYIALASLKLYERLIREGAWWDLVDDVAQHLVGRVLLEERSAMNPILDGRIEHKDLWLRRAALIAQVTHKARTDTERLFAYCVRCADEKEFFIRKAIGWALRAYSWTDPEAVREFLVKHRGRFSGLSLREGAKQLVRSGRLPVGC